MELILAMLADDISDKAGSKRWERFPHEVQREAEVGDYTQNFALYRYLVNNALRYPKEWIDNNAGAKILVSVTIKNKDIAIKNIKILSKTQELNEEQIVCEVEKTLNRAKLDFPHSKVALETELMLEWKTKV